MLYARALEACLFIQQQIINKEGRLLRPIVVQDFPRLQKILLTSATIYGMDPSTSMESTTAYFQALELMISPHGAHANGVHYTTRDLILASFVASYLLSAPPGGMLPSVIVESLSLTNGVSASSLIDTHFNPLDAVRASGDHILDAILKLGGNTLPFMLLLPEQVARIPSVLFPSTSGVLPALCTTTNAQGQVQLPSESRRQESNLMTGSILLALAKRFQDLQSTEISLPGFGGTLNVNHSLAMMFYYLALALLPSPSTYNNMGIILSMMSTSSTNMNARGGPMVLTSSRLAQIYYAAGLQMDPNHPHLLTNLGSLYKDQGNLEEAVK